MTLHGLQLRPDQEISAASLHPVVGPTAAKSQRYRATDLERALIVIDGSVIVRNLRTGVLSL